MVSPDGKYAAFSGESRDIGLWDVRAGVLRAVYRGHRHEVSSLSFHPSLPLLASAANGEPARIWSLHTGQALEIPSDVGTGPHGAYFSPDGRTLALASSNHVDLHDVDGTRRARLATSAEWNAVSFSADSLLTFSNGLNKPDDLKLWDLASGKERLTLGVPSTYIATLSPDGASVVACPYKGACTVMDAKTGAVRAFFQAPEGPESLVFSADSRRLLVGRRGISVFETAGWRLVADYPDMVGRSAQFMGQAGVLAASRSAPGFAVTRDKSSVNLQMEAGERAVTFSPTPDGSAVIGTLGSLPDVATWDARTGARRSHVLHQRAVIGEMAFGPDGSRLALLTEEASLPSQQAWVVELKTGTPRQLETPAAFQALSSLAWSPAADRIAVGTMREAYVLDARSGKLLSTLGSPARFGGVHEVLFLSDSRLLVTVSTGFNTAELRVYDARSGKLLETVDGPVGHVSALALSPDGRRVALSGAKGTVIADTQTLATLVKFSGARGAMDVAWTPDGKRLAMAANPAELTVWDARAGRQLAKLEKPKARVVEDGHHKLIRAVAISPDGKWLVSGGNTEAELWDLQTFEHLTTIEGDEDYVRAIRWAPQSGSVAIGRRAIQFVRIADGEAVFMRFITPRKGPVTLLSYTRSGLYSGDPTAQALLRFRDGADHLGAPLLEASAVRQNQRAGLVTELNLGCWLSSH